MRPALQEEERKPELCCHDGCEGKAPADHSAKRPEGKRFVFIFATNQRAGAGAGGQSSGFEFQVQQEELITFQRRRSGKLWSGETVSLDDNGEGILLTSVTRC